MPNTEYGLPIEILLVEDSETDARLTVEALREGKLRNNVCVVQEGEEALAHLRREGKYAAARRPDLILLDLTLAGGMDGKEVLQIIKEDSDLKRIPVVVMTSSRLASDILKVYNLHGNCYVTKPLDIEQFIKVVQQIQDFWFTVVKLPAA